MHLRIVLIFSGAVCIFGQSHELCHSYGCFESGDTQLCLTDDGDEVYYADFKNDRLVWDSRLPSGFHVPHAYSFALHYRAVCKTEMQKFKPDKSAATKTKEPPEVTIYPRDEVISGEENTLICFISHFFPCTLTIKWTKNGEEVKEEDPFIKCLASTDGTFYVFSNLNFLPNQGDIYTCTVEHESLEEPLTKFWDVETNEMTIGPAVFCGLGLSLGLFGIAAGTFFFVKGNQFLLEA